MNELERIERKVVKEDSKVITAFIEYLIDLSPKARQHVLSGVTKNTTELCAPLTLTEWEEQGATLAHQHSTATPWAIADWLLLSERVGMGSKYERAAEILKWTPAACRVSACVGRAFPPAERYVNLTFAHHASVAALDADERRRLLDKAVEEKLSVSKLRVAVRELKTADSPEPKPENPRFVLDGLSADDKAELAKKAAVRGETLVEYMLSLVRGLLHGEPESPNLFNIAAVERVQARNKERLERLQNLHAEVMHARSWQERTAERVRRLLQVASPTRAQGLAHFVNLFEDIYGKDKLPLLWMLKCVADCKGFMLQYSRNSLYLERVVQKNGEPRWHYRTMLPAEVGRLDYTEKEEARRIAILKEEQAQLERENPNLYALVQFVAGKVFRGHSYATEGGEALHRQYFRPTPKLLTEGAPADDGFDELLAALEQPEGPTVAVTA